MISILLRDYNLFTDVRITSVDLVSHLHCSYFIFYYILNLSQFFIKQFKDDKRRCSEYKSKSEVVNFSLIELKHSKSLPKFQLR